MCLTKHHAMNTYWRSRGIAPHILNFGEGQLSVSHSIYFTT